MNSQFSEEYYIYIWEQKSANLRNCLPMLNYK